MTTLKLFCEKVSSMFPNLRAAVLTGFGMAAPYISLQTTAMPCTGMKTSANAGQCNRSTL